VQATILLTILIFAVALLYSSVGHGGASGYLAAMALMDVSQHTMKPAALVLNILVSIIGTIQFVRAGAFNWSVFWPFIVTSIPCALVGGKITLPGHLYRPIVAFVLAVAAARLMWQAKAHAPRHMPLGAAMLIGAGIGLLSGLAGVGGGIFLTPLLLMAGWAEPRQAAGISAAFILVNSVAGIVGYQLGDAPRPENLGYEIIAWAIAALVGGTIGSWLGSRRLGNVAIRRLVAAVVAVAAVKFLLT
jgi:uncharacterized protein